ncbi:MAG: lysylphosphatidylglycerol synthase transmembrane domain-containing protein [Flavobacteriales bacterium]
MKTAKRLLTLFLSLGVGILLIWLVVRGCTPKDMADMKRALTRANLWWLLVSALLGMVSHISRAIRWNYTLSAICIQTGFWNRLCAVVINYLVNLAIPRMGEVSRCAVLSRYENTPFDKTFGTLITERVIDLLVLVLLAASFVAWQHHAVLSYLHVLSQGKIPNRKMLLVLSISTLVALAIGLFCLKKSNHPLAQKIKTPIRGLVEGMRAIDKVKQKWAFIGHTILIWSLYMLMTGVCYFALPETTSVPFSGVLGAFVLGGISIIITPGGLGAYPIAIQQILLRYGVTAATGYAFGWLVWLAQTLMVLTLGLASTIALPLINKGHIWRR